MRLAIAAWWLQIRLLSRSPFFVSLALMTPIAFVTIALLMAGTSDPARLTHVVFGAGLMGAWSATLFGAGEALYMQRYSGTMEVLVGSPRSLVAPVLGFAAASVTLGVYSIVAVWLWAALIFRVDFTGIDPVGVSLGVVMCLLSLSSIGVVLAAYYVLSRQALTVSNFLEYPIWIVSGLMVPASLLWPPLAWIGRILPFGWAVAAVNGALDGVSIWGDLAIAALLSVAVLALGIWLLRRVDLAVRVSGEMNLR